MGEQRHREKEEGKQEPQIIRERERKSHMWDSLATGARVLLRDPLAPRVFAIISCICPPLFAACLCRRVQRRRRQPCDHPSPSLSLPHPRPSIMTRCNNLHPRHQRQAANTKRHRTHARSHTHTQYNAPVSSRAHRAHLVSSMITRVCITRVPYFFHSLSRTFSQPIPVTLSLSLSLSVSRSVPRPRFRATIAVDSR